MEQFKHAIVYGQSVKHQPQRVGLSHELADEDISECPIDPSACHILTVCSHDHKTMIVLNKTIGRGSPQLRRIVPRFSSGPHCQVNKSRSHRSKMSAAKAGITPTSVADLVEYSSIHDNTHIEYGSGSRVVRE